MFHAMALAARYTGTLTHDDMAAFAGRIAIAAIFILSGFSKIADPAGTVAYIESAGIPFATLSYLGAVGLEIGGGVALIIGLRIRLVAAALALFSMVAAFGFHAELADPNQFIHFFKNVAMAGGLLQIVAFGGGRASLGSQRS